MFLFHGKSDKINDQIEKMANKGMSETQIIRELKSAGYDYNQIEKGILDAIKKGVIKDDSEEPKQEMKKQIPEQKTPELYSSDVYDNQPQQQNMDQELNNITGDLQQDYNQSPDYMDNSMEENASMLIEELIEGVVEEKWQKLSEEIEDLKKELMEVEDQIDNKKEPEINNVIEPKLKKFEKNVNDFDSRLEDLEARMGSMEKAFKKVLPSLTEHIDKLNKIVSKEDKEGNPRKGLYQEVKSSGFDKD